MIVKYLFVIFLVTMGIAARAEDTVPSINDDQYKVSVEDHCEKKSKYKKTKGQYKPQLRNILAAIKTGKPNFAGKYYLIEVPTPVGGAYTYTVIDCVTHEEIPSIPDYYEYAADNQEIGGYEIEFSSTSRLAAFKGVVSKKSFKDIYPTRYFEMSKMGDGIKLIKEYPAAVKNIKN